MSNVAFYEDKISALDTTNSIWIHGNEIQRGFSRRLNTFYNANNAMHSEHSTQGLYWDKYNVFFDTFI